MKQKNTRSHPSQNLVLDTYRRLYASYGPQHWWPAKSSMEMIVGAILTQNTAWTNVEKAIRNLKEAKALNFASLRKIPTRRLAALIRPSGFFNQKAQRIKGFINSVASHEGGISDLLKLPTERLRERLLGLSGIGPETADSIILYAAKRSVFVIDAYTRRIFTRLGNLRHPEAAHASRHPEAAQWPKDLRLVSYDSLRLLFEKNLPQEPQLFNEYHALIVRHAKIHCRVKPVCNKCPLEINCKKHIN